MASAIPVQRRLEFHANSGPDSTEGQRVQWWLDESLVRLDLRGAHAAPVSARCLARMQRCGSPSENCSLHCTQLPSALSPIGSRLKA